MKKNARAIYLPNNKAETVYFTILRNGTKEYLCTEKKLGATVWVNKKTSNVSLVKPGAKDRVNFTEHVVRKYVRPTEYAINHSKVVL